MFIFLNLFSLVFLQAVIEVKFLLNVLNKVGRRAESNSVCNSEMFSPPIFLVRLNEAILQPWSLLM